MKRWLFFIILCICGLLDSFTVKSQEALYIFRNDEQLLSAFFYSEIDSITYSVYDEAGVIHNEYVAQVVHTPDSVYHIPLAVIDSVTFVQPETIYQPGAYELDARYTPYVKTADSLTITFASSLPPDLKPSKGNVLYNFAYQAPFERGFLGRVKSVNTNADGIVVDCDLADITDVFEQYVSCQIHTPDGAETKAVTSDKTETINKDFTLEVSHDLGKVGNFTLGGNLNYNATIKTVVLVLKGQKNICIQSTEEYALTATYSLGLDGSVDGAKNILFPIRFPVGILECSIQPQICFEINASATLNAGVTYTFKLRHEYGNINGEEYDGKHEWSSNGDFECSGDLTFEGSALIGLNYQIAIGLPMQAFGVGLDLQAAPQFTGTVPLKPSLDPDTDTKLYESIKDANISLAAVANISPCAIVMGKKMWKSDNYEFSFNVVSEPIYTGYLFPEFSELSIDPGAGIADISSTVSRDVIFPQKIGYALYDENGGLRGTVYSPTRLWFNKEFKNPMKLSFDQLEYNTQYTVYPVINLWEMNILANPAKTFKLEAEVEAVDLGLSVKWASCNLGASTPEEPGGLYGWGDPTGIHTEPANDYDDKNETFYMIWGYYGGYNDPPAEISGTTLDIANSKLGEGWRLPTHEEQMELETNCTWERIEKENGIYGYKITGKNGNSIFLPTGMGYRYGANLYGQGSGYYWSGTVNPAFNRSAYFLEANGFGFTTNSEQKWLRSMGLSVRPVKDKE